MTGLRRLFGRLARRLPRPLVEAVARRYVAGTTEDDLMRAVGALRAQGFAVTADILGENATDAEEVAAIVHRYCEVLGFLAQDGSAPHVSIKPTQLGLRQGESVAFAAAHEIVACAAALGGFVEIDMEDSSTTDATIRLFRRLRGEFDGVGMAIQAYLRRSVADIGALADLRPSLRICKGIYVEPEDIALRGRAAIRDAYLRLVDRTFEVGGRPAFATHDAWLVDRCLARVAARGADSHEFQMLAGVGHALRGRIVAAGSRLRVYVPYGPQWLDYSLRRLQENPRLLAQVLRGVVTGKAFFARH